MLHQDEEREIEYKSTIMEMRKLIKNQERIIEEMIEKEKRTTK